MTELELMAALMTTIANMQDSQKLLIDCVRTTNERINVLRERMDAMDTRLDVIENIQTFDAQTLYTQDVESIANNKESAFDEMMSRTHSMAQKIRQRQDD